MSAAGLAPALEKVLTPAHPRGFSLFKQPAGIPAAALIPRWDAGDRAGWCLHSLEQLGKRWRCSAHGETRRPGSHMKGYNPCGVCLSFARSQVGGVWRSRGMRGGGGDEPGRPSVTRTEAEEKSDLTEKVFPILFLSYFYSFCLGSLVKFVCYKSTFYLMKR